VRIVLFGAINEPHVGESLARALGRRGHEVYQTGRVWRGPRFPDRAAERDVIEPAVRAALEWEPDVVLCLQASALRPRLVKALAAVGAATLVWFADDPVLYDVTYRHVVDLYDIALHCGPARVLEFYERRHGVTGVSFPFWADEVAFPAPAGRTAAEYDAVFLGNADGPVRGRRYGLLAALPADVRLHGRVEGDPAGIAYGHLDDHAAVVAALRGARVAISVPQRFADYRGHRFDFAELSGLGSFELPSRVVQYAAAGLPVVSLDPSGPSAALPEMRVAADAGELGAELRRLLADRDEREALGRATRERFERRLTAGRRVELLERLLADPDAWRSAPAADRATLWRAHDPAPPAGRRAGPPPLRRRGPSVLVAGYYGASNAGDELILETIAGRLARGDGGARVVVAAQDPAEVTRRHGLPAFRRTDLDETEAGVRDAAAVVLGGGGLWHDHGFGDAGALPGAFRNAERSMGSWMPPVVMARALGRPVHVFGLGVGPLEHPDARRLAGWLAAQATSVSVRDAASLELLDHLGARAEQGADPVYAVDLPVVPPAPGLARMAAEQSLLAVNLRPWGDPAARGLAGRVAEAVTAVARRRGSIVLGLPFHAGPARDERPLGELLAGLGDGAPGVLLPWTGDAGTLGAVLRASAAVVTMRLHPALLAHRVGTPCVGLAYDPKVAAHFAEVGRPDACLALDAPAARIEQALEAALAEPPGAHDERVAEREREARRALDRLAGRVAEALSRGRASPRPAPGPRPRA
jgi:polysaccharide pyruvyl transferase CsaB